MKNYTDEEILSGFKEILPVIFSPKPGITLAIPVAEIYQVIKGINLNSRWAGYEKLEQMRMIVAFQRNRRMALTKAAGGTGIKDDDNKNFLFIGPPIQKMIFEKKSYHDKQLDEINVKVNSSDELLIKLHNQLQVLIENKGTIKAHDLLEEIKRTRVQAANKYNIASNSLISAYSSNNEIWVKVDPKNIDPICKKERSDSIEFINKYKKNAIKLFLECDASIEANYKLRYVDGEYHKIPSLSEKIVFHMIKAGTCVLNSIMVIGKGYIVFLCDEPFMGTVASILVGGFIVFIYLFLKIFMGWNLYNPFT